MTATWLARAARLMTVVVTVLAAGALRGEAQDRYALAPGDVIDVTVLEDPALSRQALVRPDGRITMPLAGSIIAAGRSPERVAAIIRSRLSSNFREPPSVSVALVSLAGEDPVEAEAEEELEPRDVFVIGEVASPGRFVYEGDDTLTILQALSLAGGPGPFAARTRIQVRETVDGAESVRVVNYDQIEMGGAADLSALADGAVIIVPERGFMEFD